MKTILCKHCNQKADIKETWEYLTMLYEIKVDVCSECSGRLVEKDKCENLFRGLTIEEYIEE